MARNPAYCIWAIRENKRSAKKFVEAWLRRPNRLDLLTFTAMFAAAHRLERQLLEWCEP